MKQWDESSAWLGASFAGDRHVQPGHRCRRERTAGSGTSIGALGCFGEFNGL